MAEVAGALGVAAGAVGKVALDVVLLAQSEVGEVSVSAGGRSSAMPNKRNPVQATQALAAARLATTTAASMFGGVTHEHERGAGALQAEWQTVPDLFRFAAGAVYWIDAALKDLTVYPERMRGNLTAAAKRQRLRSREARPAPRRDRCQPPRFGKKAIGPNGAYVFHGQSLGNVRLMFQTHDYGYRA